MLNIHSGLLQVQKHVCTACWHARHGLQALYVDHHCYLHPKLVHTWQRARTWLRAKATPEKRAAAATPAAVPSRLTAPSVPLGTTFSVVMRYAVLPYACAGKPPMFLSSLFRVSGFLFRAAFLPADVCHHCLSQVATRLCRRNTEQPPQMCLPSSQPEPLIVMAKYEG